MKKLLAAVLGLALCFVVIGCGEKTGVSTDSHASQSQSSTTQSAQSAQSAQSGQQASAARPAETLKVRNMLIPYPSDWIVTEDEAGVAYHLHDATGRFNMMVAASEPSVPTGDLAKDAVVNMLVFQDTYAQAERMGLTFPRDREQRYVDGHLVEISYFDSNIGETHERGYMVLARSNVGYFILYVFTLAEDFDTHEATMLSILDNIRFSS